MISSPLNENCSNSGINQFELFFISGITKFDLMGEFSRLDWLGNFRVVILYNLVFEVSTAFCLVNKFTASVRNALYEQVHVPTVQFFRRLRPKAKASV